MNKAFATFSIFVLLTASTVRGADAPASSSAGSTPANAPGGMPYGVIDPAGRVPEEIKAVNVDEHLGQQIPGDLLFTNEHGEELPLSSYFKSNRPIVMQLGYYQCPMLCNLVSRGLMDGVKDIGLRAGTDFDMLFISIDPTETPSLAAMKRQKTIEYYGNPQEASGFHFMVGKEKSIRLLTDAAGFRYQEMVATMQYAHPAVVFVLTPDGKLSRYLYGVKYDSKTLRLSLVEAAAGKIGTAMDKLLLICLHYDSSSQHYVLAITAMRTGGVLTILGLGGTMFWLFRREFRERHTVSGIGNVPGGSNRISEFSNTQDDGRLN